MQVHKHTKPYRTVLYATQCAQLLERSMTSLTTMTNMVSVLKELESRVAAGKRLGLDTWSTKLGT